ncbi:MAG: ATP-binding protein [Acidimicrobiaceae bacterium]|nr:ATP-binding protein [Acidimicrobiaceae bacterium]MYE97633.1 ATP-binding protein [Acidimicrobiaceae bacterium]MYI52964.1 ATP-binding protein [Acidimicrobiaceae bacterium]
MKPGYAAEVDGDRPRYFPDETDVPAALPFTPGFGSTPPCLVGRDELIREVCALLAGDPAGEGGANVLLAPRGMGKTVLLNEIEDAARSERGWLVLAVSGTDGDPIAETHKAVVRAQDTLAQAHGEPDGRQVSAMSVGAGGLSAGASFTGYPDLRRTGYGDDLRRDLGELAGAAARIGVRVLLTMDEMHAIPLAKARRLGSYVQHIAKRERQALVFLGAALPYVTETLLADRKSTFLQRLAMHKVDPLSEPETRRGLREPIQLHGGLIGQDALDAAISAVAGHPYMLQLVGDRMWRAAGGPGRPITVEHARKAVAVAGESLEDHLFAPTWRGLSDTDKRFLAAMAALAESDESPRVAAVCEKAAIGEASASAYRRRLLLSGMVGPGGRGRLRLAHPAIGPWVRRSVAAGSLHVPQPPQPGA